MKTVWGVGAFFIAAAVLSAATPAAQAARVVSSPAVDVTLLPGGPLHSKDRSLFVGGNPSARAYLRWRLPASAGLRRASLELYSPTGGEGFRVQAGRAAAGDRLAAPRALRPVGFVASAKPRSWLKLDVTRFARAGGSLGFVVSKSGLEARLASREAGAQFRPRLVLDFEANDAPSCKNAARKAIEDTRLTGRLQCSDDGSLRYRAAGAPVHGSLSLKPNGAFTYKPQANYHGVDAFRFVACEIAAPRRCARARVQLLIRSVNDAPTARPVSVTTAEDVTARVVFSGADVDGDRLTYVLASKPEHGSAVADGDGATYTPDENRSGPDSFSYLVYDGKGATGSARISVDVTPVNDAPIAHGQAAATTEDAAKTIVLGASDVEGDPLEYTIVSGPTRGALAGAGSERTYTPASNYHGPDWFTFKVSDGAAESSVSTVALTITSVNDAPVAQDQAATTAEDLGRALTLDAVDVDGDSLQYTIVSAPSHGSLSGNGADRTYTPELHYHGPDSFTYRVSDGSVDSNLAVVTLAVDAVNDLPVADSFGVRMDEDAETAIVLTATDVETPSLDFAIVDPPAHGTLSGTGATRIYTPDSNYNGSDSFTYKASDGTADSNVATVTLSVSPVNDVPVVQDQEAATPEDTAKPLALAASDVEGDALEVTILSGPTHGVLSGTGVSRTYTPEANYNGPDSFTYKVGDGTAESVAATVTLRVDAVNDVPLADSFTVTTPEDAARAIVLSGSDVDSASLDFTIVAGPAHGTLSGSGANRTYTPARDYHGADSFTYKASDGAADSNVATISLTVSPVNDQPVVTDQSTTTREDTTKALVLTGDDVDGDALEFAIVAPPAHGTLSGTGASRTYTPNLNFHGADSFTYRVNDGTADSSIGTVTVTVDAVNDVPVAENLAVTTQEDVEKAIVLPATDVETASLDYTIVAAPEHGTLAGSGATRTYVPALNYHGPDSFTFRVSDGTADSNVATVALTVASVNDAPVAENLSSSTPEDTAKALVLSASDADGDLIDLAIVSGPAHGTLAGTGANWTYTPDANYNGTDSFTYQANDGGTDSNVAVATIAIAPVNDAPIAAGQSASTPEDTPKTLLLGAVDVDGDPLVYEIVASPEHGALSGAGTDRTFTPAAEFFGNDSFTYRVSDGTATSDVAAVTLAVTEVNDAPTARPDARMTPEDVALTFSAAQLLGNDARGPPNESAQDLVVSGVGSPVGGTVVLAGANVTFTPDANFNGEASFTYTVTDDGRTNGVADPKTATGTVTVTVDPVNDVPVAANDHYPVAANALFEIPAPGVLANDDDIESDAALQTVQLSNPSSGTLVLATDGSFSYQPAPGFNGRVSFTYKANDGVAASALARVTIDVGNVNNVAPVAHDRSVAAVEDRADTLSLSATDADGDHLMFSIVTPPAHGLISGEGGPEWVYTPDPDFNGADSFTYRVEDGTDDSNVATVSLTVAQVNDPPTATTDEMTTAEDAALRFAAANLVSNDVTGPPNEAGQALAVTAVGSPVGGSVELADGDVVFTPAQDFNGAAGFSYTVSDDGETNGSADPLTAQGTVNVAVTAVNDPPVAHDASAAALEDATGAITLSASDVDGDALSFTIVTPPAHGTISGTGANRAYTPDANYNGPDSFTFQAADGVAESNVATVTLTIAAVNDAPVAGELAAATAEDTAVSMTLPGTDIDGDELGFEIVDGPAHGHLSGTGAARTYTPDANYHGPDSFTFRAVDGSAESNVATVTLTVAAVNDAPAAAPQAATTPEDTAHSLTLFASDVDGDELSYEIVDPPAHGQLTGSGAGRTYTPDPNYHGPDAFTFQAADGSSESNVATVTLTVAPVNDAPVAADVEASASEDAASPLTLLGSDVDGDELTYEIVSGPAHGSLAGSGADRTYMSAENYNGPDSFTYKVSDGSAESAVATVTLTVDPVNDAPAAADLVATAAEDAATPLTLTGSDIDGDELSYEIVGGPAHGSLTGSGGERTYRSAQNYNGPDSFTYRVSDGSAQSGAATVTLTVEPVNDAPVAADIDAPASEDVASPVTLVGTDVDGDALTYEIVAGPAHGSLTGSGTDRTYTSAQNYNGPDSFTYKVSDGSLESGSATVTVTVDPVNDAPVVEDVAAATGEDTATAITLAANDVDGDPLDFAIVAAPSHGSLSGSGAERTYTPDPDYNGPDEFTFKAADGSAESNVATVAIQVSETNDPPSPTADELTTEEDTPIQFAADDLLLNDGTGPPNEASETLRVTAVGSPVGGAVELVEGGITFSPDENFNGVASFSYTVADDGQTKGVADSLSAEGTVNVTVTPVNDPPVALLSSGSVDEDGSGPITLRATDVDGDTLSFAIFIVPSNGHVSDPVGDQAVYTPLPNYSGPDSFMFIASDGMSESELGVASVDVTSINDAPVLDASGSPHLTPVNANASNPVGDTVAEILASGAGGDPVLSDVDGDALGIAVTAVDDSDGAWQFRTAAEAPWTPLAGAGESAARLLDLDSHIRFVPSAGWTSDATRGIQFRAWDHSTGSVGQTADATAGSTAFSAEVEEAQILVFLNTIPQALDDTVTTSEDVPVTINVLANDSDADGEELTVSDITAPPVDGTATIVEDGKKVLYVPRGNANGNDQLTYSMTDPRGGTASAKVRLTITPVNDAPIARDDVERVAEDGIVVFDPTGNDLAGPLEESGGALTLRAITTAPGHGAATIAAGSIRYTPTPGYAGPDAVGYEVCDGAVSCSQATVDLDVSRVAATVETDPIPHASAPMTDAADDAAIWVNPDAPAESLVIGTNKYSDLAPVPEENRTRGGLVLYDLDGNEVHYTNDGRTNNVDLRSGFTLGGQEVTLVVSSQRTDASVLPVREKRIAIYRLDPSARTLTPIHSGTTTPTFEPLGACMYRSRSSGDFFVFIVAANGWVEQWRLTEAPGGLVDAANVRTFRVNTPSGSTDVAEGCVADDQLGSLYISEEDVGIWKYSAEPDGGEARTQVDVVGGAHLAADIEGLAIAYGPGDTGYLIASSQGNHSYAVYRREGSNAFVRSFKVKDGAVDGTTVTDGIDVTTASLGPAFPNGVFVAQDNNNTTGGSAERQNFKLVPLEQIVPTEALGSNGSCARPYADSSPWNLPVPLASPLDPGSAARVGAIAGPLTSSPAQFTFPVYVVDDATPRQQVTLTGFFSNVTNGGRTLLTQQGGTVMLPIPAGAMPAAGADAQMIMVDPQTGDEWGFSRGVRDPVTGAWTGWNAYHYNIRWSGVPPYDSTGRPFIPRGSGMPYLAGLVRPCELARGRIDHAIAFAYDFPAPQFVYPATKSDGDSVDPLDLPEGARLQLDPALTDADLTALGCTGHCLTIARALQVYGMYVVDASGRPKVMLEYEGTAGWGGAVTSATVSPIPMSAFRLLAH